MCSEIEEIPVRKVDWHINSRNRLLMALVAMGLSVKIAVAPIESLTCALVARDGVGDDVDDLQTHLNRLRPIHTSLDTFCWRPIHYDPTNRDGILAQSHDSHSIDAIRCGQRHRAAHRQLIFDSLHRCRQ